MSPREEVEWWLRAARRDLHAAEILHRDEMFEGAAFHSQQAAEKALKAVLVQMGHQERTNSCVRLLRQISRLGSSDIAIPDELFTDVRTLDLHYISSRYPNGVGGAPEEFYDERISSELLTRARRIYDFAMNYIGSLLGHVTPDEGEEEDECTEDR